MRRVKYLLLFALLLIPAKINALTGSLTLTCNPTTVAPGGSTTCTLKGTSDGEIASFEGIFGHSEGITISNFTLNSNLWSAQNNISDQNFDNKLGFLVSADVYPSGEFDIATFTATVSSSATADQTISLTSNIFVDTDANATKASLGNVSTTISVSSDATPTTTPTPTPVPTNKGLSALTITNGSITGRDFDPNDLDNASYVVILESASTSTFGINATPKNSGDSITCKDAHNNQSITCSNITFSPSGGNQNMWILIDVGSGDNKVTYELIILKPSQDASNELSSLTIGGKSATQLTSTNYMITLDDVSSYEIVAILADETNFKFSDETLRVLSPYTLSGEHEVPIIVVPKDSNSGLEQITYILTIKKASSSPTGSGGGGGNTPTNPPTGDHSLLVIMVMLILSFGASIYLYKRNAD